MTLRALPEPDDVLSRILYVLEEAGWHDEEECDGPDDLVREVSTLVQKAAEWKTQVEHLDRLSLKMAARLDKLTLDKETLRDKIAALEAKLAVAEAKLSGKES